MADIGDSTVAPDGFEFLDETLPVLRVRDLLSVDEMVQRNPSFLGVTEKDVMNYTYDFFPFPDKARGISKTWREIINQNTKPPFPPCFIPMLHLHRTDAPSPNDDVEQHMRVLAIQDVNQRQQELERAAFPYKAGELERPQSSIRLQELKSPIEIASLTGDTLKITAFDTKHHGRLRIPIIGFKNTTDTTTDTDAAVILNGPNWRSKVAAAERIRRKSILEKPVFGESVQDVVKFLSSHGISYESLSAREFRHISNGWEEVLPTQKARRAKPQPSASTLQPIDNNLLEAIAASTVKLQPKPEKLEELLGKIERRLTGMEAPVAGFSSMLPSPLNPLSLAEAIEGNEETISSFVEAYRDIVKNEEKASARNALELALTALKESEQWPETLKQTRDLYDMTLQSVFHTVHAIDSIFPTFTDEKQAKAGDDITGYTGSITTLATSVESIVQGIDTERAGMQDIADAEDANIGTYEELAEGSEVLKVVIMELKLIAQSTKLPIDINVLAGLVTPQIDFPTRLSLLEERLTEIPKEQLEALLADPAQAEWYDNQTVKRALLEVMSLFKIAVTHALSCALASWTIILQETFAERRLLDYAPPPSMTGCASMWGFHGPPMTRTKGRGTLMYLLCAMGKSGNPIFADFLEPNAEQRVAAIGDLAESLYPDRAGALKEQFESLKPVLLAQKEALKKQQTELKKFLEGNGTIDRLVAGILQLPKIMAMGNDTIIPGAFHRKHSVSCCSQRLGADFRAYADWPEHRPLRGLLAQIKAQAKEKQHLSKEAPAGMMVIEVKHAAEHAPKQSAPSKLIDFKIPESEESFTQIEEFQEAWRPWLPPNITPRYVEQNMQNIAKHGKQPKAYAAWIEALNAASFTELAKLGMQIAKSKAACIYNLRGSIIREQDEQRVLDMVRAIITSWAVSSMSEEDDKSSLVILNKFAAIQASPHDLSNKISELRERQKASVLNKLNSKDPEMRKLLTQMNRLGVVNIREGTTTTDNEGEDAVIGAGEGEGVEPTREAQAEQDFAWRGEDADEGAEYLDA